MKAAFYLRMRDSLGGDRRQWDAVALDVSERTPSEFIGFLRRKFALGSDVPILRHAFDGSRLVVEFSPGTKEDCLLPYSILICRSLCDRMGSERVVFTITGDFMGISNSYEFDAWRLIKL